jgi:hypothetical protein
MFSSALMHLILLKRLVYLLFLNQIFLNQLMDKGLLQFVGSMYRNNHVVFIFPILDLYLHEGN